jgi:predicted nucleic acid-binding protein
MALWKTVNKLFFDTSAIYSFINRADPNHQAVSNIIKSKKARLVITSYIFNEVVTLVNARLGHKTALAIGNILINAPEIEYISITKNDEAEAWKLFGRRDDKKYSFTDCTSFVIMKRVKITAALALDEHFRQEGFEMAIQKEEI